MLKFLKAAGIENPKTTVSGVIALVFGFIVMFPQHFGGPDSLIVSISKMACLVGIGGVGVAAKDFGTKVDPSGGLDVRSQD